MHFMEVRNNVICWITFHLQEFLSPAVVTNKKII